VAKKLIIKTTKNQTKTNNDQREQTLTNEDEQHGFRKNNEGGHRRSGRVSSSWFVLFSLVIVLHFLRFIDS
jgi:hypothetical protein